MSPVPFGDGLLERMVLAVHIVRERLRLAVQVLDGMRVAYAVAGDFAVAAWVERIEAAAVRNSSNVDVLVRRDDVNPVRIAMESAGLDVRVEGRRRDARRAVRLLVAGECHDPKAAVPRPSPGESQRLAGGNVLALDALVRMELTAHDINSRVNVRDLIDVGLVDATWVTRVPPVLAGRLQQLLDDPDG